MVEKNYSYLAIQLSKFCQAYGRRQLEIAFLQLREHVLKVDPHQVEVEHKHTHAAPHELGHTHHHADPHAQAAQSHAEPSRSSTVPFRRATAMEDNMTLGFQTLSSILALQLRHALRRWENFARRKQFEERQSKVVHALRNVQAELDGKRKPQPHQPHQLQQLHQSYQAPRSVLGHSPDLEIHSGRSPGHLLSPSSAADSTPHFRSQLGEWRSGSLVGYGTYGHGSGLHGAKKSHGFPTDDDFVKSLCEDQARIDEVIKLAAILWDHASLANMQSAALPTVLLKASLLARMAERCQRHVLKEALHLLWKRCTLKRSMEELLANNAHLKVPEVSQKPPEVVMQGAVATALMEAMMEKGAPTQTTHPKVSEEVNLHETHEAPAASVASAEAPAASVASAASEEFDGSHGSHGSHETSEKHSQSHTAQVERSGSKESSEAEVRHASMASAAGFDALAEAIASPVVTQPPTAQHAATAQHMATSRATPGRGPAVTAIMAGLESEEPSEAESDIDDDALVAILG